MSGRAGASGADPAPAGARVFRALCPACGYLHVAAERFRLMLGRRASYSFRCPGCDRTVRRPAGERIVELLTAAGVPSIRLRAW